MKEERRYDTRSFFVCSTTAQTDSIAELIVSLRPSFCDLKPRSWEPNIEVPKPRSWEPNIEVLKTRSWEPNIEVLKSRSWEPNIEVLKPRSWEQHLQARADYVRPSWVPTSWYWPTTNKCQPINLQIAHLNWQNFLYFAYNIMHL
jgi:hypothetical protein